MSIKGIGCDIVDVRRIEKSFQRFGQKFLKHIFTKHEIEQAPPNSRLFFQYLAARYAAKEAYSKALGTGIGKKVTFKEIEISTNASGAPFFSNIKYSGISAHLSLSHEYPYSIAYVVLEITESTA